MKDLFNPIVDAKSFHPTFKVMVDHPKAHQGAITIMNEVFNSMEQIDNDFIQQFQSNNCDARIWELYLMAAFHEMNFTIHRVHDRPDFELVKNGVKIFIEAVTSNPAKGDPFESKLKILKEVSEEQWPEFVKELRERSTTRLSAALFNKLRKEYWNLEWVAGQPLVLALAPFHHSMAQWLSDSILSSYLYGFENTWHYDESGQLQIDTHKLTEHPNKDKTIPSNFFGLENSEHVSAVLFSNSATISKFNRMGTIKGYGHPDVKLVRYGTMIDHDPNAAHALPFSYIVGNEDPPESWREGLTMFHNPNALHPVDPVLFPDIGHAFFRGEFTSDMPAFHPIQSTTQVIISVKGESWLKRIVNFFSSWRKDKNAPG